MLNIIPFNKMLSIYQQTTKNSERQFSELMDKSNEQKEYFTKKIDALIKSSTEILEQNNSINEMKDAFESIGNRADPMEKRIRV